VDAHAGALDVGGVDHLDGDEGVGAEVAAGQVDAVGAAGVADGRGDTGDLGEGVDGRGDLGDRRAGGERELAGAEAAGDLDREGGVDAAVEVQRGAGGQVQAALLSGGGHDGRDGQLLAGLELGAVDAELGDVGRDGGGLVLEVA